MTSWTGQSRGGALGYKIFGWSLKYLGLNFAYFLLIFVSAYFVFASRKSFKAMYYYFHHRLGYNKAGTIISIFRNYNIFGQVIIDKTAILGGLKPKLNFNLEGKEYLRQLQDGGILISGHIGNWEVGGHVLDFLEKKINILIFDSEKQAIKKYMSGVLTDRNVNIITIQNDLTHLFEIKRALSNKEIIALHGDRFIQGNKTLAIPFLGEPAPFPLGPWHMASYFNVPVSYVFAVKESRKDYRFFATPVKTVPSAKKYRENDELLGISVREYVTELEKIVRKYPLQWFNYYDFWKPQ